MTMINTVRMPMEIMTRRRMDMSWKVLCGSFIIMTSFYKLIYHIATLMPAIESEHSRNNRRLLHIVKFVAESADGQNVVGMFDIFFDLAAQPPYMDIDGTIGDKSIIAPDIIQDLIP